MPFLDKIKTADIYMIKTFLWAFITVLALFVAIGFVIVMFDELDDILDSNTTSFGMGLTYILLCVPHVVVMFTPIVVVLSIIFGIGGLVKNREMLMLYVAGYSPLRLAIPLSIAMLFIILFMFVFNEKISGPFAGRARILKDTRILGKKEIIVSNELWLYGKGDRIYQADAFFTHANKLTGFNIFEFEGPNKVFSARLMAEEGVWNEGSTMWTLKKVFAVHIQKDGSVKREKYDKMDYFLEYTPKDFQRLVQHPEQMSHKEMKRLVDSIRNAGEDPQVYLPDLRLKEAFPFAVFFLGILAYAMVVRFSSGTRAAGVGIGLLAVIGYFLILALGKSFARSGMINATLGAWGPNIVCLIFAIYLFRRLREEI